MVLPNTIAWFYFLKYALVLATGITSHCRNDARFRVLHSFFTVMSTAYLLIGAPRTMVCIDPAFWGVFNAEGENSIIFNRCIYLLFPRKKNQVEISTFFARVSQDLIGMSNEPYTAARSLWCEDHDAASQLDIYFPQSSTNQPIRPRQYPLNSALVAGRQET